MKIYLPHPNLTHSARCLDDDTLEHQITNAVMVAEACAFAREHRVLPSGLRNGKESRLLCVGMWAGYEGFLLMYLRKLCLEAGLRRGWSGDPASAQDNPYVDAWQRVSNAGCSLAPQTPKWYGLKRLHRSHQSELIKTDTLHYGEQFPTTPLDMPYLWPLNQRGHFAYTLQLSLADRQAVERGEMVLRPKDSEGITL